MINSAFRILFVARALLPSLDAPPRHRRSSLFSVSFGRWLGEFLRAGVCVLLGSSTSARLGVCLKV